MTDETLTSAQDHAVLARLVAAGQEAKFERDATNAEADLREASFDQAEYIGVAEYRAHHVRTAQAKPAQTVVSLVGGMRHRLVVGFDPSTTHLKE